MAAPRVAKRSVPAVQKNQRGAFAPGLRMVWKRLSIEVHVV
jgi:hypothetical protein